MPKYRHTDGDVYELEPWNKPGDVSDVILPYKITARQKKRQAVCEVCKQGMQKHGLIAGKKSVEIIHPGQLFERIGDGVDEIQSVDYDRLKGYTLIGGETTEPKKAPFKVPYVIPLVSLACSPKVAPLVEALAERFVIIGYDGLLAGSDRDMPSDTRLRFECGPCPGEDCDAFLNRAAVVAMFPANVFVGQSVNCWSCVAWRHQVPVLELFLPAGCAGLVATWIAEKIPSNDHVSWRRGSTSFLDDLRTGRL